MAFAFVEAASTNRGYGPNITLTLTITLANAPASGSLIVLGIFAPSASTVSAGPTCTNTTFTLIDTQASNYPSTGHTMHLYRGLVSGGAGGTSITVTMSALVSGGPAALAIASVFTGVDTASPFLASNKAAAAASSSVSTNTHTTSSVSSTDANGLVVAFVTNILGGASNTPGTTHGSSFTNATIRSAGGSVGQLGASMAYRILTATGSYSTTAQFSNAFPTTHYGQDIIAVFQSSGGGGGPAARRRCGIIVC